MRELPIQPEAGEARLFKVYVYMCVYLNLIIQIIST